MAMRHAAEGLSKYSSSDRRSGRGNKRESPCVFVSLARATLVEHRAESIQLA